MSQLDSIMYAINECRNYYYPNIALQDNKLYFKRNIVGYVTYPEDSYYPVLVLTMQINFLPKSKVGQLVKAAREHDILIAFIWAIDIGFGLPEVPKVSSSVISRTLSSISNYSTEEVKTAAVVCGKDYTQWRLRKSHLMPLVYSYNQFVDATVVHAEDVVAMVIKEGLLTDQDSVHWVSLLEPCEECLRIMIDLDAKEIQYFSLHKPKWNTSTYIELVSDIHNRLIKTRSGVPVKYEKTNKEKFNGYLY